MSRRAALALSVVWASAACARVESKPTAPRSPESTFPDDTEVNADDEPDVIGVDQPDVIDGGAVQLDSDNLRDAGANTVVASSNAFRYGINAGYPNPEFDDQDLLGLALRAGSTSQRVSLPESHLERWGYDIEVGDVTAYRERGMGSLVAFLTSPTRAHSSAPPDAEDWELAHYAPKNLYEPITVDGQINPDNYWADYVYRTVSTYKQWIGVWEIWNEPDWVADWQVTQDWLTGAPSADELPRWSASIYEYVRLLRVSSEAAKLADPNAKIATGGLGYPSFLDAVLRYSDEPEAGAIDDAHPATGAAYIDVVSFHHYPIYTPGNSEAGVDSFLKQRAQLGSVAEAHGSRFAWECTETGAPHLAVSDSPGGDEYARNYLLKVMTLAQGVGIGGVHWFTLSDGAAAGESDDPYSFMGLYQPVAELADPSDAALTQTGLAYATLTELLAGYTIDVAGAADLPAEVRGATFTQSGAPRAWVLWAVPTTPTEETASASLTLRSNVGFTAYAFDASETGESERVDSEAGTSTLHLNGTPQIFIEQ